MLKLDSNPLPLASSLQFLLLSAVLELGLDADLEVRPSRCLPVVIGISTGTHFSFLSGKEQYQNSVGRHEPLDRLYMIAYTFQEFVQTHPVVLLDSNLYEKAFTINEKMAELYQLLGESGAE